MKDALVYLKHIRDAKEGIVAIANGLGSAKLIPCQTGRRAVIFDSKANCRNLRKVNSK